ACTPLYSVTRRPGLTRSRQRRCQPVPPAMTPSDLHVIRERQLAWSRRTFLGKSAQALGSLALGSLLNPHLLRGAAPASPGKWRGVLPAPHFLPRAKRVIHLCMAGGPSHIDLFDPKPL